MFDHFVGLTLKGSKRTSKPNRKNIRKVYFYDRKKKISRNRKKKKKEKVFVSVFVLHSIMLL